jgi:ferredoxin-type protein NapH
MSSWIKNNRFLLGRRISQVSIILLFYVSAHFDWKVGGVEILEGNLSASKLLGAIPLTDPFALLQILFTGHSVLTETFIGAIVILAFYTIFGGRSFCSWVCPMNIVTDTALKFRIWLKIPSALKINRSVRYYVLGLALIISALTGIAAFEWISPISMLHRELIFGMKLGWTAAAVIFLFDLFIQREGWCGHLCPLGAFYSIPGRFSQLRLNFNRDACTKCGDCHRICPEPQVLNLRRIGEDLKVTSANCTNCGRCVTVCPEQCFQFSFNSSSNLISSPQFEGSTN